MTFSPRTLLFSSIAIAVGTACKGGTLDGGSRVEATLCDASPCTGQDGAAPDGGDGNAVGREDPPWGCLGSVPPLPAMEPDVPVHQQTRFVGLINAAPLAGLQVKACGRLDITCAQPITGTSTDENGSIDLQLFSGFRGFLDVPPSTTVPDLVPALVYLPVPDKNVPATGAAVTTLPLPLLKNEDFELFMASVGKSIFPQHGHLSFLSLDCQQIPAIGVVVQAETITAETFIAYTDASGLPSLTQQQTSARGGGFYGNLPVGNVTVIFSRTSGERIARANVNIRAGTITYLSLDGPTP